MTLKSVIIGATLSVVLGAANAYFGFFLGLTVSASIPAAVISMAVLKAFKNSNILENNLIQTAASAGESLAAGIIFTLSALVIMGYWEYFNYLETTLIAICGGVLGVLFTIPLRKALIVKEKLAFPEGVATAEVLKTGEKGGDSIKYLIRGSLLGGLYKFGFEALNLWSGLFEKAILLKERYYLYFSLNLSPALVAVGYIVGLNISFLVFLGGVISWYVGIPLYILLRGAPEELSAVQIGGELCSSHIRYLGVGAMIVGGLWALAGLRSALAQVLEAALEAFKNGSKSLSTTSRIELDTPMSWVLIGIGVMTIPIFFIYLTLMKDVPITLFISLIMIVAGFLFSAVAGYMAGLVGSSNNPISGVTIVTILITALLLLLLMGTSDPAKGAAGAILVGAIVCCAAAIAGDNMQDLKAGHILGSTPRNQQIMQMVGVVSGALLIAPILNLLLAAKGIGLPTLIHPHPLSAPQATLMMSVALGIFGGNLPWDIIVIGGFIGVLIILADEYFKRKKSNFKMPILAVAVGLYLPFELDSSIFIGGLIAWLLEKRYQKAKNFTSVDHAKNADLLMASGLITGEALIGILIAVLTAVQWNFPISDDPLGGSLIGLLILTIILIYFYQMVLKIAKK